MQPTFDSILRIAQLRFNLMLLQRLWAKCLAAAGLLALAWIAGARALSLVIAPSPVVAGALAAAAALGTMILWLGRRPSRLMVATAIDEHLGLKERFSTAVALGDSDDPFAQAACAQAHAAAREVRLAGQFPLRPSRHWAAAVILWAAALAAGLWMPDLDLLGHGRKRDQERQQAQQLQQAREQVQQAIQPIAVAIKQLNDPALTAQLAQLDQLTPIGDPDDLRRQAIRKLGDLSDKLQKAADANRHDAMKELSEMLKGLRPSPQSLSPQLNQALAQGDFEKAARTLRDLERQARNNELSPEQSKVLSGQLADLAAQLNQLAQSQKSLQEQLAKAGLDKDLAKLDEQQLRDALAKQGLSPEAVQKLLQQASQCRSAQSNCQALAQAAASGAQGGDAGNDLSELGDKLSDLEALQQELKLQQAGQDQIRQAIASIGQKDGQSPCENSASCSSDNSGQGPWSEGSSQKISQGSGGPGKGYGPRDSDEAGDVALQSERVTGPTGDAPPIASWYFKGPQVKGESKVEMKAVVQAGKDAAAEAITEHQIPRKYEGAIQQYFGELEASGQ